MMVDTYETNLAAVVESPQARVTIKTRPIPNPGANEMLVRNHAVASGAVDWKIQDYNFLVDKYPTVLGSDISGIVAAVGASVTKFKPGDRVAGFAGVICNSKINHGAFQTYTIVNEYACTKLPSFMSFEEGSILPMAVATAAIGLFVNLEIPRPTSSQRLELNSSFILVWGGASSVGTMVIQIAKKLGLTVIVTASPVHHDYLKSLGATLVFDYKDPEVVSKLVTVTKNAGIPLTYAFDCVSEGATFSQCVTVLSSAATADKHEWSKLALLLPWPDSEPKPKDIAISQVIVLSLESQQKDLGEFVFNEWLQTALEDRTIVPSPRIEIVEGGLQSTQKVWDTHKAGVSGKKLVLQVG